MDEGSFVIEEVEAVAGDVKFAVSELTLMNKILLEGNGGKSGFVLFGFEVGGEVFAEVGVGAEEG